jgi:hypothetical protein
MAEQNSAGLPLWSTDLMGQLDEWDREAKELAAGLTAEQLNWQPAPGSWSIGQCLDHLCATTDSYLPAITTALQNGRGPAVQEIAPGGPTKWFIRKFIEPSRQTSRAKAPKKIVPNARVETSVLDRFVSGNQAVRALIRRAAPYEVNRIRFKNPFVPVLRFTVGAGLLIICRHERRHLLQAERVKGAAEFPK